MPELTTTANETLDYPFLLVTHMICADQQIYSEESKALHELADKAKIGQRTIEEMEKILSKDEHHISMEYVAGRVSPSQQNEAMRQISKLAYGIYGFFSPLECERVERLADACNCSIAEILQLITEAGGFNKNSYTIDSNDKKKLSLGARLLRGADLVLPRSRVNKVTEIALKNIEQPIEQQQHKSLLSESEYDDAIQKCAAIATEDYKFAELALKGTYSALDNLEKGIQNQLQAIQKKTSSKGEAKTASEVAKQLETTRKALTVEIIKELENVSESLSAKQRALNHFSIAFMGKTKAGKSTLHAIITDGGWDAIGEGKQRTTRENRVYEWKNIRIIDTPGIGAPGGKTDEEIAETVIEESDVICYVVTNDSIQESEFNFLKLLKEKAKPLIVLLNVKHNLRDSRRLEYFLKDPNKLFAMDGKSGLGGHIERIHRYAKQHYANDYFDIVPVLLLATQMSREPEHKEHKDRLFKASRLQDFLDSIRVSLVEHGVIRRSQTLLGSTVSSIDHPEKWVIQQAEIYQQLTDTLKEKRELLQKQIKAAKQDNLEYLQQQIEAIFQDGLNTIPSFAEDYWEASESGLKHGWEKKLKAIRFEERLKNAYEDASKNFNKDVQEAIEEVGNELQLIAKLGGGNFSFKEQDSFNFRNFVRIGGGILAVTGLVLGFFVPPLGILGLIGGVMGMFKGWFKSQEQKRREAVQNISKSLNTQLKNQKQATLGHAKSSFSEACDFVRININTYFKELIQGLELIAQQLETAKSKLDGTSNYLNRAYAKRIIDWSIEQYEPLTEESINRVIAKVKRDFGCSMNIQTKSEVKLQKSQENIKRILQEDVSIQTIKY